MPSVPFVCFVKSELVYNFEIAFIITFEQFTATALYNPSFESVRIVSVTELKYLGDATSRVFAILNEIYKILT